MDVINWPPMPSQEYSNGMLKELYACVHEPLRTVYIYVYGQMRLDRSSSSKVRGFQVLASWWLQSAGTCKKRVG